MNETQQHYKDRLGLILMSISTLAITAVLYGTWHLMADYQLGEPVQVGVEQWEFYEQNASASDASAYLMSSVAKCANWNVKSADRCVRLAVDSSTIAGEEFHEKVLAAAKAVYPKVALPVGRDFRPSVFLPSN